MKTIIKSEQIAEFVLGLYLFTLLEYDWWWFPVLILIPDVSIAGYLYNAKVGSWIYNFFHHKVLGIGLYILGSVFYSQMLCLIGLILFAHSSLDRALGFGLKFEDSFFNTHLGKIGMNKKLK